MQTNYVINTNEHVNNIQNGIQKEVLGCELYPICILKVLRPWIYVLLSVNNCLNFMNAADVRLKLLVGRKSAINLTGDF